MRNKRLGVLILALVLCVSCLVPVQRAEAATTYHQQILKSWGTEYRGDYYNRVRYDIKGGLFGKTVKINSVNYLSQLSKSQCNYWNTYTRFRVYVVDKNGYVKKFYQGLKMGSTFRVQGNAYIIVESDIDSSGWGQFYKMTYGTWPFAQYNLSY